jgi:Cupredoxin-like domain
MAPALTRRLAATAFALGLLAAACGEEPPAFEPPEPLLVPQVADFLGDVGRGASIASDAEGNPHIAYLGLAEPVQEGAPEVPRPIGSPEVPAVLLAILNAEGMWEREPVAEMARIKEESDTAIAVDADGVNHVVWTEWPVGLSYSSDPEGTFTPGVRIGNGRSTGISIAVGETGGPWVSWIEEGAVRAGSGGAGGFTVEEVATVGAADDGLPASTAIGVGPDGQPLVAFTDPGRNTPMIARRDFGGTWSVEEIDPGGGGYGISLALDADGQPHAAYYTRVASGQATVRLADPAAGGGWQVSDVGELSIEGDVDPTAPSTGVAVDDQGVRYVAWYAGPGQGVRFALVEGEDVQEITATAGLTGASPDVVATPDGSNVYVAWYDSLALDLQMAVFGAQEFLLANPTEPTPFSPPPPSTQPPDCQPSGTTLQVFAANTAFNTDCLAAPAQEPFTIVFDNQDTVQHNVAIYTDVSATTSLFVGDLVTGPDTIDYSVDPLDPGQFFFRCDVHPTQMTGNFVVDEVGGGGGGGGGG